ncbi:MAG: hypothetical protein ACERKO_04975 [Acetanaerobacterium sp.]
MKRRIVYTLFSLFLVSVLPVFSGCTIAKKAPGDYLTAEYYAAPTLAPVTESVQEEPPAEQQYDRTTAEPVKPEKGKPPKTVIAAPVTAAPPASSSTSSSVHGRDKVYSSSETYDKKETLGNVEIAAADVVLENKYITGNLTVTSKAYYSLTLTNCRVDGRLVVESDSLYELFLIDTTMPTLSLSSGGAVDVELEGMSYIAETVISGGTSTALYAYNIDYSYSGYKDITIQKSSRTTFLDLYGIDCETLTANSRSSIMLSDSNMCYVDTFVANAPVTVEGAHRIDRFYVRSDDVQLYGEPNDMIYGKSNYTVEYL